MKTFWYIKYNLSQPQAYGTVNMFTKWLAKPFILDYDWEIKLALVLASSILIFNITGLFSFKFWYKNCQPSVATFPAWTVTKTHFVGIGLPTVLHSYISQIRFT